MRRYLFLADALRDLNDDSTKSGDEHPGRLPEIRTDGHSVTFEFDPTRRGPRGKRSSSGSPMCPGRVLAGFSPTG